MRHSYYTLTTKRGGEQIIGELYEKKANKIQASNSDGGGFGDAGSYPVDAQSI